ncbi:MAG: Outer-membrane-phospholipid-binding lipoprotein MlaA [uncultured Paraburkholderia sp.]|uniref:MlaA family lipoprotein n=1 Tax=uncultured Paraburkholderia sp. TaxID=1822466 RepID=UPI002597BA0D|nr:MlaA family lipoprotein [uncultured Paraburkholderia sp.]CAH2902010.1 MAG: Outer-membrane-phospholipid-binding lipoprotein MlaA [uncultured Paraburkholderia sp.]CAH2936102.1 MAG: Outer-membrane-phospholipid-binding lipoprotein MlaA [uncultured Paraburkholderia sp.]
MKLRTTVLALAATGLITGCATGPDRKPGDPFEPMNRAVFNFNDGLDRYVAVPVAKGYQKVTPQPLRTAVSNFFSNLGDLTNAANALLQLKITDATEDLVRFAFNSTFGLGGLLDWATPAGLPKHHQDFGLTLGHWGIPSGPYLVLPLFGPSTVRDSMGLVVDVKFNPLNYMEPAVRNPLYVLQFVSVRSDLLGATDLLQQAALDKYSFVRDAYTQQRRARLRGTGDNAAPLPEYEDQDDSGAATTPAKGAAAGAPATLPNYADPGDTADTPDAASGAATGAPAGVPNYTDPGESPAPASGAAGSMPASETTGAKSGTTATPATAPGAASAPSTGTAVPPTSAPAGSQQPASAPAAQ